MRAVEDLSPKIAGRNTMTRLRLGHASGGVQSTSASLRRSPTGFAFADTDSQPWRDDPSSPESDRVDRSGLGARPVLRVRCAVHFLAAFLSDYVRDLV